MDIQYITDSGQLRSLCGTLAKSDWLAIDTEFIREKTYYPRLCLIQVATDEAVACVDPLRIDDISPLLEVIYDPAITKIMHAARQDLEILFHLRGNLPHPLFDTQIAATVLGQGEQVGYGNLVKAVLNVELDKAHARTDWSRRPLDAEQLEYAADDVRYLGELYRRQRDELDDLGRSHWLDEDFAQLTDPGTYRPAPRDMWKRLKGSNRLRGIQLAVLRELAAWREEQAIASDRPRRWIVKDDVLLDLARQMPESTERMSRIRGLEPAVLRRHGATLAQLIRNGREMPRDRWPTLPRKARLRPEEESVVDALAAIVRQRGLEQAVSPAVIATRRDLECLIQGDRDVSVMHGWRASLVGSDLEAFLAGRLRLEVTDGRLRIERADVEDSPGR